MGSNNTQGAQILIHQSERRYTQTATAGIQKDNYIYIHYLLGTAYHASYNFLILLVFLLTFL